MVEGTNQKRASVTESLQASGVASCSAAAETAEPPSGWFAVSNAWLEAHLDWVMWLVVLAGLYLRIQQAGSSYLNGDEADIMIPPLQSGIGGVFRAALPLAHAPLVSFLLHFM